MRARTRPIATTAPIHPRRTSTPHSPRPIDLSKTIASKDVSLAQVEQADAPDWNQGADPYLRIEGWKRP
ncbi:hypothetical protein DYE20_12860 [[Mycobacterium] chelonae subsp. gwanakae]|nr:hypothetical protein DYE20_12860 [[Mycobacterium] chelonae subsp. gwanakae]